MEERLLKEIEIVNELFKNSGNSLSLLCMVDVARQGEKMQVKYAKELNKEIRDLKSLIRWNTERGELG